MAYNLKLSIYRVSLKKKGGSKDDLLNFEEFFRVYKKESKEANYKAFIEDYVSSFNKKFRLNKDKTKGISVNDVSKIKLRSTKNLIDGEIIGGQTGIPQSIFKQTNSIDKTGFVNSDDVKVLPYYIKLWTPIDHDTGVLMIQSYSNLTIDKLVKLHLSKIFDNYKFGLVISNHIPNKIKEEFKNDSDVYKVAFVKESLREGKRKMLNQMFTEFEDLKIRIEVSGFKKKAKDFWEEIVLDKQIISSNLEDFDIKENDDYKFIAYYKDSHGHKSHTTLEKSIDIKPTIFLDHSLKQYKSEIFDFEKLKKHTDELLESIQEEIGYKI